MSGSVLFQNRVLPWNEVYRNIVLPQSEMFGSQNEVYRTIVLPQSEVFGSQNMILPQNEAFAIVLPQNEVNISVLLQGGIFRVVIVSWQLFSEVKAIIDFVGVSSACSKDVCLVSV